jgi:hypothetical protein
MIVKLNLEDLASAKYLGEYKLKLQRGILLGSIGGILETNCGKVLVSTNQGVAEMYYDNLMAELADTASNIKIPPHHLPYSNGNCEK